MLALLRQSLLHINRTRFLIILLAFSFVIQYLGVRIVQSVTIKVQGIISVFDYRDSLFVALLFQLFTGVFLAAVYGIWMVPYSHQGQRSQLTFTLPVSKWTFPLVYALSMFFLLFVQDLIMLLSFGANFGFGIFASPKFPWKGLLGCLMLETLAFEMFMFAFASSAMALGQITTFFLGAMAIFILQIAGAIFRFNLDKFVGAAQSSAFEMARSIYTKLPPVGELVYDLRQTFLKPDLQNSHAYLWLAWIVIGVLVFRFMLRYPMKSKGLAE